MADERMVRLLRGGQPVDMAVTPADFFRARVVRKDGAPIEAKPGSEHYMTYAEAGYALSDRYESLELYDGPRTKRAYERQQEERRAARSAPSRVEAPKPEAVEAAPKPAEAKKAD